MEPDIIHMYSSSPPPLDNGTEEDEDEEFGDFGGFSGAGSTSVGFDFASGYSGANEELKASYNSDYSGNSDGTVAFPAVPYANDKERITELPNSIKGFLDSSRENCECKSFDESFDEVNSLEVKRCGKLDSSYPEIIRTDMTVPRQDQQIDHCNGEKQPCSLVLTNGFVIADTANSQGVEDMNSKSDSKGLKTISTHSTELSLDSAASPAEDFANFGTFSNKQTTQGEETGNKICKNASESKILHVHENNIINRVEELMKEPMSEGIREDEEEISTEGEWTSISNINLVIVDDLKVMADCTSLERNTVSSIKTNVNSVGTMESTEGKGESDTGNSKEHISWTHDVAKTLTFNISTAHHLSLPTEEKVHISETIKNGESSSGHASCSGPGGNDFGDFGTVSNGSPLLTDGAQASAHQEHFQIPNVCVSKLNNECGDFTDRNDTNQWSREIELPQPNAVSGTPLEELQTSAHSGATMPSPAELENGNDSEFGDLGSVAKGLPDSDDFSDFTSAGCNRDVEWNAFEAKQKESCTWAAFEEQAVVESHPGRDSWPLHRTDSTSGTGGSVTASICITSWHGTGSGELHELPASARTVFLNRLERIFEACFPSVLVSEIEEEIAPLNLLLEVESKPERTEETLSERELVDVWTELQDIHDAYGLRYQWGGSHSNKKLLCSLGIDTRNILFTGNRKQPVIVPMYAAGLGMLEPTKEPLKPLSAAEKIASLGQSPAVSPEMNICAPDQSQALSDINAYRAKHVALYKLMSISVSCEKESLPPVQFDWSSSGLTNPLDASGGSTLLNLDFFGPMDDSSSSTTTTIPGVDPELYELTTSKLETSSTPHKVTDAFAKLMSTVEKASSSARKPRKEEQLSEEAGKVISSLPDLSFMHAKVLMFPATLTPSTSCQAKVD